MDVVLIRQILARSKIFSLPKYLYSLSDAPNGAQKTLQFRKIHITSLNTARIFERVRSASSLTLNNSKPSPFVYSRIHPIYGELHSMLNFPCTTAFRRSSLGERKHSRDVFVWIIKILIALLANAWNTRKADWTRKIWMLSFYVVRIHGWIDFRRILHALSNVRLFADKNW